jgi:hypothetical protein
MLDFGLEISCLKLGSNQSWVRSRIGFTGDPSTLREWAEVIVSGVPGMFREGLEKEIVACVA